MRANGSGQGLTGAVSQFPRSLELIPSPDDCELQIYIWIYIRAAATDTLQISTERRGTEVSVMSVCHVCLSCLSVHTQHGTGRCQTGGKRCCAINPSAASTHPQVPAAGGSCQCSNYRASEAPRETPLLLF